MSLTFVVVVVVVVVASRLLSSIELLLVFEREFLCASDGRRGRRRELRLARDSQVAPLGKQLGSVIFRLTYITWRALRMKYAP